MLQNALGEQYRVEREIGRGGMGVVYLATDIALERTVAVKVISPELALNHALADRFIAEARLIARVRHPNILSVYTAGATQGLLYYVMDYVDGESLRELLHREGRLDPAIATSLSSDIAAALDAAARAGVVHRDIKPENILIEKTGSGYRALLADFGIAFAMWSDGSGTGAGIAMGTPAYMSPEQAAGEGVDARSDIYSLGVVTFEMLAGRPPFDGPRRTVISRQIVDPPPDLLTIRPDTPGHLVSAVTRALEKVPDARWQTGHDFQKALMGQHGPLPKNASVQKRKRAWVLAAAIVVSFAAAGWGMLKPEGPPRGVNPRHSFLVLPFGNLRDDTHFAWLASGSVSMLDLALGQWRELTVIGQERVHDMLMAEGIEAGSPIGLDMARRLAREAGVWTVVLGEFERTKDSLHLVARAFDVQTGARLETAEAWGHLGDDARLLFDDLAARLLELSGAPDGQRTNLARATSSSLEAYRAYLLGLDHLNRWNLGEAEEFFQEAITIDSSFSLAFFGLAMTRGWRSTARDTLSTRYLAEATRFSERLPLREQQMIGAYRALFQGEYPKARGLYQEILTRDSADAEAWYGLGDAWFHDLEPQDRAGAMTTSLAAFRKALSLDPHFGLAYEHVTAMLNQSAQARSPLSLMPGGRFVRRYTPAGNEALSTTVLQRAVTRAQAEAIEAARAWTEYQPETIRAHRALLEAYLATGDPQSALSVVARIGALLSDETRPLAGFLEARVRLVLGDASTAAGVLRDALSRFDPLAVSGTDLEQQIVFDVLSGANVFAYVGDLTSAETVIRVADQLRRRVLPPGTIVDAYGDDRVWKDAHLSSLHSSIGTPPYELRELWRRVSRVARGALPAERPFLAWAGASAAQGLLLGESADPTAIDQLRDLTGVPPRPELRALVAAVSGDSATARAALAEGQREGKSMEDEPHLNQSAAFAMGDPRPITAEVHFLLGDYLQAVNLLESFQPERLVTKSFDSRWGLLARVRLLRGLAYEKLGRTSDASREFSDIVAQWDGADARLMPVVEQARAGLSRLRGATG
jgi:serine/threonine-protein kinase